MHHHHPQQTLHCWSLNYLRHIREANQHLLHSRLQPYHHQHKILRLHRLMSLQSKYLYYYLGLVPMKQPVHNILFVQNEPLRNYHFDFQNTNHRLYMYLLQQKVRSLNLEPFQYQRRLLYCLFQEEHLLVTCFFLKSTQYLLYL